MQVSENTSLGVGMLKSFTEHNQLRTGIISKSYPNYSSTNYLSAMQSYKSVLNKYYCEIITNIKDNSAFSQETLFSIPQHNPGGKTCWIVEDDDCLCLFNNLQMNLDFLLNYNSCIKHQSTSESLFKHFV